MSFSIKRVAAKLRPFLSPPASFEIQAAHEAGRWLASQEVGSLSGKLIKLDRGQAQSALRMLLHELEAQGLEVLDAFPDTRQESLLVSADEKTHRAAPRARRIAVKAFPGQPLTRRGAALTLDPEENLEIEDSALALFAEGHDVLVLVENWESFQRLPSLHAPICQGLAPYASPLALWRGGPSHSIGAALRAAEAFAKPCFALVDYDSAGLALAAAFPHFIDMLAPPEPELRRLMLSHGRRKLFAQQRMPLASRSQAPRWSMVHALCSELGAGLPQEHFNGGVFHSHDSEPPS